MAAFWVLFKQARRDSPSLHAWVLAFNILSGLGFILLAVVFFTALLSSRVKRVSTWYCYMMAWMAFCITPFPVIGHQTHADPPPSFAPCVVNSALMYASRPFAAFGTLSLILQLYLNVSARLRHREVRQGSVFVLLVIPPILYFITFFATLLLGIVKPTQVKLESGGFYCHVGVAHSLPAVIIACFVLFAAVACVVIEAMIMFLLSQNWRAFRGLQIHDEHTVSLSIIIRVSVFAFLPLIGLGLSFTTYVPHLVQKIFPPYNLLLASLPTTAAVLFGSQTDIVHVWMFWRVEGKTMTQLTLTTMNSDCSGIHAP
ncbi:hypothetical protein B0H13DRAFT_347208 [Mycena leptocephala]|nr:hypothetical protein B0H13DRAFT_347208 [Mycena leptocephala]